MTLKIAWFSTGTGPGSRNLLRHTQFQINRGILKAKLECVFSNREPGEHSGSDQFFSLVTSFHIPLITYSSSRFYIAKDGNPKNREDFDKIIASKLDVYRPDLIVLAGYKLILSKFLCTRFTTINLHPALPAGPIGTWQDVIWQLIGFRSTHAGATVHLVTEHLDEGPPISYFEIPIATPHYENLWSNIEGRSLADVKSQEGENNQLFRAIREAGLKREGHLITETLQYLLQKPSMLTNLASGKLTAPISLTDAIEELL